MKRRLIAVFAALCLFSLSSCSPSGPSDYIHVLAMGVDTGENGDYVFSFLAPGENDESENNKNMLIRISAPSFERAKALAGIYTHREINVSHMYLALFSLDAAERGLKPVVSQLFYEPGLRAFVRTGITRCSAYEYLVSIDKKASFGLADHLEKLSSDPDVSPIPSAVLGDMYKSLKNAHCASVLPLYCAYEPYSDTPKPGLVIIKDLKALALCGESDAFFYKALTGSLPASYINIEDPDLNKEYAFSLKMRRPPTIRVNTSWDAPKIDIKLSFDCRLIMPYDAYEDEKRSVLSLEKERLKRDISDFLYRCAKEYNADIFGFHERAALNFLTLDALEEYGFYKRYPDSRFNVTVTLTPDAPQI